MTETETDESAAGKLNYLWQARVKDCKACALCEGRKKVVFGSGSPTADVMFVGEAPGRDEDQRGRPFVGRAGKVLDKWIAEAGLTRPEVYITNVVKCRPPDNRDPREAEVEACRKYLRVQIALIQPKVIVTLGRFAGNLLSGQSEVAMRILRSRPWLYEDEVTGVKLPVCPVYHPAYVLRQGPRVENTEGYQVAVQDLKEALNVMGRGELPDPTPKALQEAVVEPIEDIASLFGTEDDD